MNNAVATEFIFDEYKGKRYKSFHGVIGINIILELIVSKKNRLQRE
jgi:hypothetical protein